MNCITKNDLKGMLYPYRNLKGEEIAKVSIKKVQNIVNYVGFIIFFNEEDEAGYLLDYKEAIKLLERQEELSKLPNINDLRKSKVK